MNSDKQWMIMTYYCPTHGSGEKCEPIQLTKDDLLKADKKYNRTGAFTITNVEHTISQMMWTTSIEGQFRPSK